MQYLNPLNGLIFIALKGFSLIALLPIQSVRYLGRILGHVMYVFALRRKRIAARNLELCFPNTSTDDRQRLLKRVFSNLGMGLLETAVAWYANDERLDDSRILGLEHVHQSLNLGKGVIILGYHFSCVELGGSQLAKALPGINAIYRRHKNSMFESIQRRGRGRFARPVARENIRELVKALNNNELIWLLPDQDHGRSHCEFVPFFNIKTSTITSTSWFAQRTGAKVHPVLFSRNPKGIRIDIQPAIKNFPSCNLEKDTARLMAILEARLASNPDDYIWVHRRFKTRPLGDVSLYP